MGRRTAQGGALQIEQQRAAQGRCARGAAGPEGSEGSVTQKTRYRVENVSSRKESAKDLRVDTVHPLPAEFDGVAAGYEREVVSSLDPPEKLVDGVLQEERVAETKRRDKSHRGIRGHVRRRRGTRPIFFRVCEVPFVELC